LTARTYSVFLPWIVFVIVDRSAGPGGLWASSAALAVACVHLANGVFRRNTVLVSLGLLLVLTAFVLVEGLAPASPSSTVDLFGRAIVTAVLAGLLGISVALEPASTEGARSMTPRSTWDCAEFRELNRRLTARWAVTMAVVALCFGAGALWPGPLSRTACDWLPMLAAGILTVTWDGASWRSWADSELPVEDGLDSFALAGTGPTAGEAVAGAVRLRLVDSPGAGVGAEVGAGSRPGAGADPA